MRLTSPTPLLCSALIAGCLTIDNIAIREPSDGSDASVRTGDDAEYLPPDDSTPQGRCEFGSTGCLPARDGVCDAGENTWHEPGVCPRVMALPNDSFALSPDGRYVAYLREVARDGTGGGGYASASVLDLGTGRTQALPAEAGPGLALSSHASFVAFTTTSTLTPNDRNGAADLFIYDLARDRVQPISIDATGVTGNGASYAPAFSRDDATLFFHSKATNLVTDGKAGLYAYDMKSSTLRLVLADAYENAIASDEGAKVVQWLDGEVRLVNVGGSTQSLVAALGPSTLSASGATAVLCLADGLHVSRAPFTSSMYLLGAEACLALTFAGASERLLFVDTYGAPLVPEDINNRRDVYALDLDRSKPVRVSVDAEGGELTEHSYLKGVSADGRFLLSQLGQTSNAIRLTYVGDLLDFH